MYRALRPLLFALDAEWVHDRTISLLEGVAGNRRALRALAATYGFSDSRLAVNLFGRRFPNPLGLAAGLDKDARALPAWQALGFGFVEVGSVTALPQAGNSAPRLFRLPDDRALVNRMGFNNRGAIELAGRVASARADRLGIPVFVNVGKSRAAPLEEAAADYRRSLEAVWQYADGIVINVSSPNTPGLRSLQTPEALGAILAVSDELQGSRRLPVLLKLAPDLGDGGLLAAAELAGRHEVAGLVVVNTTLAREGLRSRNVPEGGLSGGPLRARALQALELLAAHSPLPIVSVGGIFDGADVVARLRAGASLVEIYTGFIYGGPGTPRAILREVLEHLDREGMNSVGDLIGAGVRRGDG